MRFSTVPHASPNANDIAIGWKIVACPVGKNTKELSPISVVTEVKIIGLNLFAEYKNISSMFFAFFRFIIIMIPSFITTPDSPNIPIIEGIDKFRPKA